MADGLPDTPAQEDFADYSPDAAVNRATIANDCLHPRRIAGNPRFKWSSLTAKRAGSWWLTTKPSSPQLRECSPPEPEVRADAPPGIPPKQTEEAYRGYNKSWKI